MSSPCPICGKSETAAFKPFCSKRCSDLDLGKWLKGDYAVPAVELDDVDEESLENEIDKPQ